MCRAKYADPRLDSSERELEQLVPDSETPTWRLYGRDPAMDELVERYGDLQLKQRPPFVALCRSIVAQQISTKAADAIRKKLIQNFGAEPGSYARLSSEHLRTYGLSKAKAECVIAIARRVTAGELDDLENLSDHEVVAQLRMTKGIGPWTAHMFLIFGLARPDIWPTSDAGLLAAARRQYGTEDRNALDQLGSRFLSCRSVAALYLWKSLENAA